MKATMSSGARATETIIANARDELEFAEVDTVTIP